MILHTRTYTFQLAHLSRQRLCHALIETVHSFFICKPNIYSIIIWPRVSSFHSKAILWKKWRTLIWRRQIFIVPIAGWGHDQRFATATTLQNITIYEFSPFALTDINSAFRHLLTRLPLRNLAVFKLQSSSSRWDKPASNFKESFHNFIRRTATGSYKRKPRESTWR